MRMFLAGLEGASHYENCFNYIMEKINEDNIYILSSFYYSNMKKIKEIYKKINKEHFLLDSGAFTFRMHGLKGKDIDQYTDEYIAFINEYDIKYFFEMDIDFDDESYKKVLQLRKRIEEGTGKKVIPVWHRNRGIEEFKKLCNEYTYIAIGGLVEEKQYKNIMMQMTKYAAQKGVKLHLLGYAKKDMTEFNAYSCDATSWNGGIYGGLWNWSTEENRPIKMNRKPDKRVKAELQKELYLHNLKVWKHYQDVLKYKGYWREH